MENEGNPPHVPTVGFLSGNETTFNYTDDDVQSETDFVRARAGW